MVDHRRKFLHRRVIIAASLAILCGFGAIALRMSGDGGDEVARLLEQTEQRDVLADAAPAAPHQLAGPSTRDEAIAAFLDSERVDDWQASFELLSLDDRQRYLSPELWAARRDGVLGSVESWKWIEDGADPTTTDLLLTPTVSLTHGVKPPAVTVRWSVVDEDGWRVDLARSIFTPQLPSVEQALEAAVNWLKDGCRLGEDSQFLESHPPLAAELCAAGPEAISASAKPARPTGRAAGELGVMFGGSAIHVLLAISVIKPSDTAIIVAPDRGGWVVIDVLPEL